VVICDAAGTPVGMRGITMDITHRKLADQALQQSEAKLRAFLEFASQAVVAVNGGGEIVLVNAQTEQMFGYSRQELLGRTLDLLVPDHLREGHALQVGDFFARPRARPMGSGVTLEARRRDGATFPVEISLSHIDEGGARLALALITDITERKRLDEQLRQSAKLESIAVLAGGVAHDFNNLLTGIMAGTSLVLDTLEPGHAATPVLHSVLRGSQRAAELTRQLLAYAGKGKFVIQPADLSALVREIVRLIESSIPKNVALRLELEEPLPAVSADRVQLQQLVMNLVINGAEAIGESQGALTIRTGTRALDEQAARRPPTAGHLRPGSYVLLEVEDTGCGMDPAAVTRIFDPFFTTKFTGRGLGLAAAQGIVRGHRGAMQVRTSPGKGSTFTVLFPAATSAAAAAPVPAPLPDRDG
jgi:PAS domain S-box-containing protein